MKKYKVSNKINLFHLDCYRVVNEKDLKIPEIGEILGETRNIVFVEWAERVSKIIPKKHITVHVDHISENERKITIT